MTVTDRSNGAVELPESTETVDQAVQRVVLELRGTARRPTGDGTELAVGGRPFAVVARGRLDVQLDPAIAAAALRTPGAMRSDRGPGWVRFEPPRDSRSPLDVDRAVAWLRLAHRAAVGSH